MIGHVRGKLIAKQPPEVVIETAGIGYEVNMPMTSIYQLPPLGEEVIVYTQFVVREDAQLLFGFMQLSDRALFRELIKTNGVGAKMALVIMSGMSTEQLLDAVTREDITALVKLPGVGKKTAERLVVELKDKLSKFALANAINFDQPTELETAALAPQIDVKEEATSALVALGYKPPQATKVINAVYNDGMTSEALIREALKSMV